MQLLKITPTEDELKAISTLYQTCFNAPDKGENWTPETAYSYFQDRIKEDSIFAQIQDADQNLIAICCGSDYKNSFISKELEYEFNNAFYISLVAISPNQQNHGLGTSAIEQYCEIIKQSGFDNVIVRCRSSNTHMQHALKKNGFEKIHEYTAELGGVMCERVIMTKNLAS